MTVERPADLVVLGGRIATMDPARSWATALAVRDGRIVAVGSEAAIRPFVGPRSRVIEGRGRTITPGFGDAHVHPVHAGLDRLGCELRGARDIDGYLEVVREYAASHPDRPWVHGGGWSMDHFPGGVPTLELLDRVVPDRPALLRSRDGHTAWVNTRASRWPGSVPTRRTRKTGASSGTKRAVPSGRCRRA